MTWIKEYQKGIWTGKHKWRQGRKMGGHQTHQMPRMRPGRAEKEIGKGKASRNTTAPLEVKRTAGDKPGYTPIPEDLRIQEVYGD